MTKISIIIPVYNGGLLLERCLDSIFIQNGNFDLEVIAIDDGSTDNSIELIRAYDKEITVLQQENQGPAAARNKGIEAATGEYLTFIDADDYWKPEYLEHTIRFLETNKDAIAVNVGQNHKILGKPERIMPQLLSETHDIPETGIILDDFYEFWTRHNHVCTGSVVMRTAIVKQTGGQRPELRITEDLEFWAYLATFGKWGFIPKILFVSDGGAVTKAQGWWSKNKRRWASAPTPEQWAFRIINNLPQALESSFRFAQGKIAKNLAYAMLLSGRPHLARQTTLRHKEFFPKDKIAYLMSSLAGHQIGWFILSKMIFLRERFK